MTRLLLVNPDALGRLGHQTFGIITGILLSRVTGSKLLLPRYKMLCDKWNTITNWSESNYITDNVGALDSKQIVYLESSSKDLFGSRKWNTWSSDELKELIKTISQTSLNSIVILPYDQSPGFLLKLLNIREVRDDIKNTFKLDRIQVELPNPYICIHIRRGDVTVHKHQHLFVQDNFYFELIDFLLKNTPKNIKVCVCIQDPSDWLDTWIESKSERSERVRIYSSDDLIETSYDIRDFKLMVGSNLLVTANSSFSHLAFLLSNHNHFIDISRYSGVDDKYSLSHCMENSFIINPDNSFLLNEKLQDIKHLLSRQFS